MKITISGTAASGKSSVAKLLAKRLGYKHFSMGDVQRDIAKKKGITITELGILESKDKTIDLEIDKHQAEIGEQNDDFVLDSWLAAHFIPDAIKIFIDAEESVRAKRRFNHHRKEESFSSIEDARDDMRKRSAINQERWKRYYGFDFLDMDNYDYVIDGTDLDIEGVVNKILGLIKDGKHV